jgi:hypothetical protein
MYELPNARVKPISTDAGAVHMGGEGSSIDVRRLRSHFVMAQHPPRHRCRRKCCERVDSEVLSQFSCLYRSIERENGGKHKIDAEDSTYPLLATMRDTATLGLTAAYRTCQCDDWHRYRYRCQCRAVYEMSVEHTIQLLSHVRIWAKMYEQVRILNVQLWVMTSTVWYDEQAVSREAQSCFRVTED